VILKVSKRGDFKGQGDEKLKGSVRGPKQHKEDENAQLLIDHSIELSSVVKSNLSVKFLLWIVYVPSYNVDYFDKNSERLASWYSCLVQLFNLTAWFSYLILSLNKILTFTNLCFLYQPWGENDLLGAKKGGLELKVWETLV